MSPTVTIRFWFKRLSLTPTNAALPLIQALDFMNKTLTQRLYRGCPPSPEPPRSFPYSSESNGSGQGGDGVMEGSSSSQVSTSETSCIDGTEAFLETVDALLHPPPGLTPTAYTAWSKEDTEFLVQQAGKAMSQVGRENRRRVMA